MVHLIHLLDIKTEIKHVPISFKCFMKPRLHEENYEKMVPEAGLEPARVSPYAPQAYVSAISPPGHVIQNSSSARGGHYTLRPLIVNQASMRSFGTVERVFMLMKAFFSFLIFCCFASGIGIKGLTPALGFFTDTQWTGMRFFKNLAVKVDGSLCGWFLLFWVFRDGFKPYPIFSSEISNLKRTGTGFFRGKPRFIFTVCLGVIHQWSSVWPASWSSFF